MKQLIALIGFMVFALSQAAGAANDASKLVHEVQLVSPTGVSRLVVEDGAISTWSNNPSAKFRFQVKKNASTGTVEVRPVVKTVALVNGVEKTTTSILDPLAQGVITEGMRDAGVERIQVLASHHKS